MARFVLEYKRFLAKIILWIGFLPEGVQKA